MAPTERRRLLADARYAANYLRIYYPGLNSYNSGLPFQKEIRDLLIGFEILDAKEQAQAEAGAKQRRLNAKFGSLGGRPRKATTKN
jgi:hypothetical protein